jgi:16S rRNA G527 N7-methylase RsmG
VLETGEAGKYFSRKIFFMTFQVPMEPERMKKSHTFAALFKKKGKTFNLTYCSPTPCDFMSS